MDVDIPLPVDDWASLAELLLERAFFDGRSWLCLLANGGVGGLFVCGGTGVETSGGLCTTRLSVNGVNELSFGTVGCDFSVSINDPELGRAGSYEFEREDEEC